jgi:hypothetical protein
MTLFDTLRRGRFARISLTRREPTEATAVRPGLGRGRQSAIAIAIAPKPEPAPPVKPHRRSCTIKMGDCGLGPVLSSIGNGRLPPLQITRKETVVDADPDLAARRHQVPPQRLSLYHQIARAVGRVLVQAAAGSVNDVTFGAAGGAPSGKSLSCEVAHTCSGIGKLSYQWFSSSAARYSRTGRVIFSVSGQAFGLLSTLRPRLASASMTLASMAKTIAADESCLHAPNHHIFKQVTQQGALAKAPMTVLVDVIETQDSETLTPTSN